MDADEDRGAHVTFNARARSWSPEPWTDLHRGWITVAILGIAGVLFDGFFAKQRLLD